MSGTTGSSVDFSKSVNIYENAFISKAVFANAYIHGQVALADATADAYGPNTVSQTLTETHAVFGMGTSAASEFGLGDQRVLLSHLVGSGPTAACCRCRACLGQSEQMPTNR